MSETKAWYDNGDKRGYMVKSKSDDHATPRWLYELLDLCFSFDYDPCPLYADFDGLSTEWGKSSFVNPPYSKWQDFAAKGVSEWRKGKTIVFLLNSLVLSTKAFHECFYDNGAEVIPVKGRLNFNDVKVGAPFASILVILKAKTELSTVR